MKTNSEKLYIIAPIKFHLNNQQCDLYKIEIIISL